MTLTDQPLPNNIDAERAVLAAILTDADACLDDVAPLLAVEGAFYALHHGLIWAAAFALHTAGDPVDLVTVTDKLRDTGHLEEAGGWSAVTDLATSGRSARNAVKYARIIHAAATKRALIRTAYDLAAEAWTGESTALELIERGTREMDNLAATGVRDNVRSTHAIMPEVVEHFDALHGGNEEAAGLTVGWPDLDRYMPLRPAEMIVVAARPSVGKTAFACNVTTHQAIHHGHPVGIISLEMDAMRLTARMVTSITGIPEDDIRDGALSVSRWAAITQAAKAVADAPILIDDTPDLGVLDIRTVARKMHRRHGIRLLIIDYLQYVKVDRKVFRNRQEAVADVSWQLKALSKQLHIPVMVLAQLNREADERPKMSHLRESGAIEQDADIIALLWDRGTEADANAEAFPVDVIVAKHRNGATGTANLQFRPKAVRFEQISRDWAEVDV